MPILPLLGFIIAVSVALVAAAGYCFGTDHLLAAYLLGAIGAGWLGILYSSLLRWLHDLS